MNEYLAIMPSRPRTSTLSCVAAIALLGACSTPNAKPELDNAEAAVRQARAERASDCAPGLIQAAEAALAQARQLNAAGNAEEAKKKAANAATLATQAQEASPPGCDEAEVAEAPPPPPSTEDASRIMNLNEVLSPIYFDYNDATIRSDSRELLSKVAEALLNSPGKRLEIEGHCDVRGSTEYNLHLGERRAQAVVRYLVKQGVGTDQVSIISYGEERPVDLGVSEDAHSRNRRAELRPL